MAIEESTDTVILDASAIDKIDHFLKPKRRAEVFSIVSKRPEISQKDLAEARGSTATALSNILVVFSGFEYKLLEFSSVGKYRFYKLSAIGRAYLRAKVGSSAAVGSDHEARKLIHEARAAFDDFTMISPYSWEIMMNRLLEQRNYGREDGDWKRKLGLEDEDYERAEQALDQYLTCIETAEFENDNEALEQILGLIENPILRDMLSGIVEVFNQFSAVIKALDGRKTWAKAYMMVKSAFGIRSDEEGKDSFDVQNDKKVKDSKVASSLEFLGWTEEMFEALCDTADRLKKNVAHMDEEDMCRYFLSILPGQKSLCAYIARCICGDK